MFESDTLIMECAMQPAYSGLVGRLIRGRRVETRVEASREPADEPVRTATQALLRHFAAGGEGEWDLIELRPLSHSPLVCLAACEFSILMDFGCELSPASTGETVVRVLSAGRRSRVAQLLELVAWPRAVHSRLTGVFHGVRRRLHRGASGVAGSTREVDMVLALPIPAGRELRIPEEVRFQAVEPALVLRHPRRYASYGVDVEQRLERGDLCVAGTVGRQVVYWMWLSLDQSFIAGRAPRLRGFQRSGYVYDSHTDPFWRGRGIYGAALHWVARTMASMLDHLSLSVQSSNLPSIRAAEKAGFRRIDVEGLHGSHERQPFAKQAGDVVG